MEAPLVSILINAFNAERHIRGALDSALAQTYRDVEIVVLDDHSTDETAAIVKEYSAKDSRVRYVKPTQRLGLVEGRNELLRQARGEFLTYLDVDDRYLPEKVAAEAEFLKTHPDVALVYCNTEYFFDGEPGRYLARFAHRYSGNDVLPHLLEAMYITNSAVMFRRSLYEKLGGYRTDLGIVEDWEFFLRVAYAGQHIAFLDKPLAKICLRWDSHTNFKKQALVQESAVNIFEDLKKKMSASDRERYHIDFWIARRKENYAIALLGNGEGERARKMLTEISRYVGFGKKIAIRLFSWLPASLAGFLIEQAWKFRKKNLYYPI